MSMLKRSVAGGGRAINEPHFNQPTGWSIASTAQLETLHILGQEAYRMRGIKELFLWIGLACSFVSLVWGSPR
jgi:hypothetical protein